MNEEYFFEIPEPEQACFCKSKLPYKDCCQLGMVRATGGGKQMYIMEIAGVAIYRPRYVTEKVVRAKVESRIRSSFRPAVYTKEADVQAILHKQVEILGDLFDSLIPLLSSRGLHEFVLWQYDLAAQIDDLSNSGKLKGHALDQWMSMPNHLRALKYIAERVTMLAPKVLDEGLPLLDLLDEAFIYAEELVGYCITSDLTQVFPHSTKITIHPENQRNFLTHTIDDGDFNGFRERIAKDRNARWQLFGDTDFEYQVEEHAQYLNTALRNSVGLDFVSAIQLLENIRVWCKPVPDGPPGVKFVLKDRLEDGIANQLKKPVDVIKKLIAGFSLTKPNMEYRAKDGLDYWNPTFHYRAYRRGLFVLPHDLGEHLAFSNRMFQDSLRLLQRDVCHGDIPREWETQELKKAVGQLVCRKGEWFEHQIARHLSVVGIEGVTGRISLGRGRKTIALDGEFDFIGWSNVDSALVLIEAKMLQYGSEPRFWRNQIASFLEKDGERAFLPKLRKKIEWLSANAIAVGAALKEEGFDINCDPTKVLSAFITHTPSPASYFIADIPCVSLTEFLEAYSRRSTWPYEIGVCSLQT